MTYTEELTNLQVQMNTLDQKFDEANELLFRMDERLTTITEQQAAFSASYVRREEFEPIQKIVYNGANFILLAVLSAVIYSVIRKRKTTQ